MASFVKTIAQVTRTTFQFEDLKIMMVFSGIGLLVSLVTIMFFGNPILAELF